MKMSIAALALAALAAAVQAAPRTVTLDVPGMTCAACPLTVKTAIRRVPGVVEAKVSYERREAVVTFDDERTGVDALLDASANAGYPASVKRR